MIETDEKRSVIHALEDFHIRAFERLSNRDANILGAVIGQLLRYREFLTTILARHEEACADVLKAHQKFSPAIYTGDTDTVTKLFVDLETERMKAGPALELDIESFYLFSKILLDRVARFLEFYFGPARGLSLDSHDKLVKRFASYADAKSLKVKPAMIEMATRLKEDVSDHRDYQIAHPKNPRTAHVTFYGQSHLSVSTIEIYPTEKSKQVITKPLTSLLDALDDYLRCVIGILEDNADRTKLKPLDTIL